MPIRINKEGLISGTGKDNLLTDEEFESLREKVCEKVTDICKSLAGGGIEIHPMKTADTSACAYCRYKGIAALTRFSRVASYNII